jgi:hypothetical protein
MTPLGAITSLLGAAMAFGAASADAGQAMVYPFAEGLPASDRYRLDAGGKAIFVHQTEVSDFACFGLDGAVPVQITCAETVTAAVVRPLSRGIRPAIDGRVVRFTVDGPGPLSVEIDGAIRGSLLLFVDPPEVAVPAPRTPGVRYFEGGRIHEAGEIQLADNESLYLAPGAVVHGTVRAKNATGVRIFGPGILDARPRTTKTQFVVLESCQDVELRDVLVLGAFGWALVPYLCTDVRLTNVKVLSWRDNDDGLDICSSRGVTVDRCFFRTKDDCIAIKAPLGDGSSLFDVADVLVRESVFWNAQWGNAMEIGFELRAASVRDIVWRDCDIIRVETGSVFSIHNGDRARVQRVLFEDIRVEDARDRLIDFRVGLSIYSQDCPERYHRRNPDRVPTGAGQWVPLDRLTEAERADVMANRGVIQDVILRDIQLLETVPPRAGVVGFGDPATVSGVRFEGIRHRGAPVTTAAGLHLEVDTAADVIVR